MRKQLVLISFLGALLVAPMLHAQTAPTAMKGPDCSKATDPKACEARREKMHQAFQKAQASCKGKEGADHRSCMVEQMCGQSKDPGMCRERVAHQAKRRQQDSSPK